MRSLTRNPSCPLPRRRGKLWPGAAAAATSDFPPYLLDPIYNVIPRRSSSLPPPSPVVLPFAASNNSDTIFISARPFPTRDVSSISSPLFAAESELLSLSLLPWEITHRSKASCCDDVVPLTRAEVARAARTGVQNR